MSNKNAFAKDQIKRNAPVYNWNQPRLVRSPYESYNDPGVDCSNDPGLTDGSQAAELDVNQIIRRAQKSGILPGADAERMFADVSQSQDYHSALNLILNANEQFMALEAELRARFDNDPAKFMDFAHDPKNVEEMVKLGLAERRDAPTPQPAAPEAPVANPGANAPKPE